MEKFTKNAFIKITVATFTVTSLMGIVTKSATAQTLDSTHNHLINSQTHNNSDHHQKHESHENHENHGKTKKKPQPSSAGK